MIVSEDSFITGLELKVDKLPPIFHQQTAWLRQRVQLYLLLLINLICNLFYVGIGPRDLS